MPEQNDAARGEAAAQPEQQLTPDRVATLRAIAELKEKLRKQEAQREYGAADMTPKQAMIDHSAIGEKNPDWHYRYVNVSARDVADSRVMQGYQGVSDEEAREAGVRAAVGAELRLMKIPRERYEERKAQIEQLTRDRLKAHKTDVRQAAEAVARELKDRHGIDLPLSRLLVDD